MRGRPFIAGDDERRNLSGKPRKQKTVADVLATVVSPAELEKIAGSMKVLALSGDAGAAQALATMILAGRR